MVRSPPPNPKQQTSITTGNTDDAYRFPQQDTQGLPNTEGLNELTEQQRSEQDDMFPACKHPAHPKMAIIRERVHTFVNSSCTLEAAQTLAHAGFFSIGDHDKVVCFYCNGGLENWQEKDDPWEEHAKWYSNCEFLLQEKGPEYIYTIQNEMVYMLKDALQSVEVGRLLAMGFPEWHILAVARAHILRKGYWRNTTDLFNDMLKDTPGDLEASDERNTFDETSEDLAQEAGCSTQQAERSTTESHFSDPEANIGAYQETSTNDNSEQQVQRLPLDKSLTSKEVLKLRTQLNRETRKRKIVERQLQQEKKNSQLKMRRLTDKYKALQKKLTKQEQGMLVCELCVLEYRDLHIQLPCGHICCKECADQAKAQRIAEGLLAQCPICDQSITRVRPTTTN